MLESEEQAERGQISDGMNSMQAEVDKTTAAPTAASTRQLQQRRQRQFHRGGVLSPPTRCALMRRMI